MIVEAPIHNVYLGLGSNQGDRLEYLNSAVRHLRRDDRLVFVGASPVYESQAHTKPGQGASPDFLNAVLHVRTTVAPEDLLSICIAIEMKFGRVRDSESWLPRTLDIDILMFDGMSRRDDRLTLPHPRMHERLFVLQPLCDIEPDLFVPSPFSASARDLLASCGDKTPIQRFAEFESTMMKWLRRRQTNGCL